METGATENTPQSLEGRVIVVGAASRDLAADDPRGWRLGGAVAYASLTLARLGIPVSAVIGLDDAAAVASELDLLRAAGVEIAPIPLRRGPVFENLERTGGRVQRCLEVADPIPPSAMPSAWRTRARGWFLGPVAGEVPDGWAEVIREAEKPSSPARPTRPPPVALGWQGLLRTLSAGSDVARKPPQPSALLEITTLVGVGMDDLDPGTSLESLAILVPPTATLVLTEGERGGLVREPGRVRRALVRYPALVSDRLVDPTGAGDVFLAALFAARLDPQRLSGPAGRRLDIRLAAAAASLVVEGKGLAGVPALDAVLRRAGRGRVRA
jgi:sugar/nucleoside kinase (ribokinase family)